MSTSNTHQQSLADADSETRPLMLERGSYIPWVNRFRRYLNRKRENRKWLNKAINKGPYEFRIFTPSETEASRMQKEEDLRGDDLKHYEAEIEAMNLILISILNDIYNSVDAYTTAKAIWQRVERLINQAIVQGDRVNIQSKNSRNDGRNIRRLYVQEEIIDGNNVQIDVGNIQRTLRTTSSGTVTNVQCYNCRPSYDSAFLSEVQTPSTNYVNPLFAKDAQEQKYLKQPKIINNIIGDDQIDINIIFDEPNGDVNSGNVDYVNNVQESYALEQLARNAYKEAEKQQTFA
uniref:Uncharacterized protein n=1 Tax=Tanacetum cinerariifolium TaxID=118510 RepID=A0A6L2K1K3_TANCI|nr:hypothetical protein [Tanacetum cinerariifolium]